MDFLKDSGGISVEVVPNGIPGGIAGGTPAGNPCRNL